MKIMIKYDKKRYQKQLKRGGHYEWMKQLSTFCGMDKGWKVLMGGIEWEGQAPWFFQGAFSGREPEACHSPEAAGIESAGVSRGRKLSSGGEGQQRTALYPGKTQLPFARGSRALSCVWRGRGCFQEASPVPMASALLATKWGGLTIMRVWTEV